ncbi:SusC/RagA family TonB-linked outer membrane protein [Aquimarina sp. 2201CG1-2-11]|uniref:SusC/RagA family TonB-linked outer membrane protein n=1 Tax=Aquimarina discodermiae TaxID=3231043 RepID=UPI003461E6D3
MNKSIKTTLLMLFATLVTQTSFAQEKTITGVISDNKGLPLPGVNIQVKDTNKGAQSDFDGKYSISADTGSILIFSYLGFANQEVTVGQSSQINVSMQEDASELEEVVVTAFGIAKEKNKLGYSAESVDVNKLNDAAENNLVNALNGQVSGVNITDSGGSPSASANIVIRGSSSILGNNQPLFVIDGIPINNNTENGSSSGTVDGTDFRDYGKTVGVNRASDINPDDIASMTVLKGGAATALYGIRAVNGAIIITTKSGSRNQKGLNISLSTGYTIDEVNKFPEFTDRYARGRNGAYSNLTHWSWGPAYANNPTFPANTITDIDGDGTDDDVSGQRIPFFRDNYKNFWQKGTRLNTNISVSGGGEKGRFYVSAGNVNHEGIVKNDTYERTNFTIKGDYDITDKFKIGAMASYSNVNTNSFQGGDTGIGNGLTYWHHMWDINRPWVDSNRDKVWFSDFVGDPNWIVNEEGEKGEVNRTIGNINFSYDITDWMKLNFRSGIDTYSDQKRLVRPISSVNTNNRLGDMYEIRINSKDITNNFNLSGNFILNEDLNLSYLVGGDIYTSRYDRLYVDGQELLTKDFFDISNAKTVTSNNSDNNKKIFGAFSEVTLDYKSFLFLTLTGRNDWSSTLPKVNNSFFYPSVSTGFVFSNLLSDNEILSYGKLKGSWAKLGNDAPNFSLQNVFARRTPNVGGQPQFTISNRQNNPNIKPELSSAWEIGGEFKFLNNLIGLDITYYERNTVDQVLPIPLTSSSGFAEYIDNSGKVTNNGIEALLNINDFIKNNHGIVVDFGFNFAKNNSEVVEVPEGLEEIIIGNGYWNGTKLVARPGEPYGTFVGDKYKRNESGQLLLDDSGAPQRESNQILGNINPDWTLNFNPRVSYKGFTLSGNLEFRKGGDLYNDAEVSWIYAGLSQTTEDRFYNASDVNANATRVFDGIIESTGEQSTIAVPLTNTYYHNNYNATDENFVEDTSWVRLRTLNLTYNLPSKILENTFINRVSVTFTGRNLWLDTNYSGADPETSGLGAGNVQGFNTITAPNTKSYGMTVKVQF